ncbi:transcriptional repressor LexA [Planctellipticum variicoloris]|jgi:repressor LexA|uniref:transcriptional repressor LexA n=1 Tax=Planctellipticum variicoloris TaxID=3064265 RepID=UPI003013C2BB|nr:transcriptional repressor LexA [Planctomycetaceae bacterium SH412]
MYSNKPALTLRQREIYDFLRDKIVNRGYGPTVREIGLHFGIRSPNGVMCHLKALEKKGLITRESHMSRAIQLCDPPQPRTALPLAGQIAAGQPVLALQQEERVDFSGLFNSDDHFCLRVKGESMIDDQIAEGDYVVVRKQTDARDGDIVVALVEGEEATLKRFYRETHRVRLEPRNKGMRPIFSNNVQVLGIVLGVIRQY